MLFPLPPTHNCNSLSFPGTIPTTENASLLHPRMFYQFDFDTWVPFCFSEDSLELPRLLNKQDVWLQMETVENPDL